MRSEADLPRVRIARPCERTHPRTVTWREVWRVLCRSDFGVPIVMPLAGAVCAVMSAMPHDPRPLSRHEASLEHLGSIAIMWFAFVGVNLLRQIIATWWSLRRVGAPAQARVRWSIGNMIGTALLAAWTTAQLTAI